VDNFFDSLTVDDIDIMQPVFEAPRTESWRILPMAGLSDKAKVLAHRLNGFGSLFYFSKIILRKSRMTTSLHQAMCLDVERWHLKDVFEIPRDHFKSTIFSEAAPMWWALPFDDEDEVVMRKLGYGDEWIRWMRRAHNQDTRTLLVSANITNAAKLGKRINGNYDNNDLFRACYPEIIPDTSCTWSDFTKTHKRSAGHTPQGEGTYDYLGVGSALQSRHYDRAIQDDLVGFDAIKSEVIMQGIIDYHKLLVGAFDSDGTADNDELVVGNRWSHIDLNSWIRENETYFRFSTHSAIGGCCDKHPYGQFIFPEEFNYAKLARWERRLGKYLFSCQFYNKPTQPEAVAFTEKMLRYYRIEALSGVDRRAKITHEVHDGIAYDDMMPSRLNIQMIVDPNHAGKLGRCKHAIVVTGYCKSPTRFYLLDVWAESASYDDLVISIYRLAKKWKLKKVHIEVNAAQKYLKFHLDYRAKAEMWDIEFEPLTSPRTEDAKKVRIESMEPTYKNGMFFCQRQHQQFISEFSLYPNSKTVDVLDTLGYAHQIYDAGTLTSAEYNEFVANIQQHQALPSGITGYN
jgi:phage terminase large subunit-like protein